MNVATPEPPRPANVSMRWLQEAGFYVFTADGISQSFVDADEAVAAIRRTVDPRLGTPLGNC